MTLGRSREPVVIRPPLIARIWTTGFTIFWCATLLSWGYNDLIALLMLAFGLTVGLRILRVGVRADETGLQVRNFFRTKRYEWSTVEDFRVARESGQLVSSIFVLVRNGRMERLDVTRRFDVFPRGKAKLDSQAEVLRRWLPSR